MNEEPQTNNEQVTSVLMNKGSQINEQGTSD